MAPRSNRFRPLIILAALIALAVVANLLVEGAPTGRLRTQIEENLTRAIGLPVSLADLDMSLLPMPHFHATGIRVANAPGRTTTDLLRIDRIELRIELWPLFQRRVVIDALEIEGADLHFETDIEGGRPGKLDLGALVHNEGDDSIQLELRHVDVESLRLFYRDGRSEASHSLILDSAVMNSEALGSEIALDLRGRFEGAPIALSGRIGSLHDLLNHTQSFPIDLHGRLFESHFEAKGSVQEPWTLSGLELEISAEIPELVVDGHALPQLGTLRFGGHLSDSDGSLGFERLRLDASKTIPVRLSVNGKVDDLLGRKEVDVEIDIETLSLEFLRPLIEAQVDFPLPTIDSLSARLKLLNQEGRLDLDGTVDVRTGGHPIVVHAKGGIRDLSGIATIDVDLEAQAENLAAISSLIPEFPTHGTFGPVVASGRVRSHDRGLAATDIEIFAGSREHAWVELDGRIADVVALRQAEVEVSFGAQSLHHLKELLEREMPQTSLYEGSAKLSDADGSLGFEHLRLHGGANGPVEIHLEARFDDLPKRDEIEIELDLSGEDSRVLGALAGIDLPVIKPVEFHAEITGSEERIEAENMTLRLGETQLRGAVSGSFAAHSRPSVIARLESSEVRVQDLGLTRSEKATRLIASRVSKRNEGRVTAGPGHVLPFESLRHFDLDLGVEFDHVGGYRGLDAKDAAFTLRLKDGQLVVTDASATYQDGALSTRLLIDARTPRPRLEGELHTKDLNLAKLISQFDEETDYSGIVDAEFELRAHGDSLDSLRRSLAGNVTVSARDGNAASRIGREFVVNLASIVFSKPLTEDDNLPNIDCALVELEIGNGIANVRRLVIRGDEVGVSGTGEVDLVQGRYDLYVVPKAVNPGALSVAPSVHVKGPLDAPEFHPAKRTLVTSFGRGLLHNVLGAGKMLLFPFARRGDDAKLSAEDCRAVNATSG